MNQANIFNRLKLKVILGLSAAAVLILCLQTTVLAAGPAQGYTALIINTTNTPQQEADEYELPLQTTGRLEVPWVWHPISVVNEPMNGFNAIRRTYALPFDVNPAVISTDDFEMLGQQFTFAYVLQQPTSNEAAMEMRDTVTIETSSRELNDILPNLAQEIWYERDGFAGTLTLNIHSITTAAAGTERRTVTATRQRTFPHLSGTDNAQIPRTITDGGTTFHLSAVDWQSSSISAVDGHTVASNYTAHATYTAQVTQTRTTGYIVTAEYIGTVFRTTQGMTLFTAVFYGEPIIEIWPDEEFELTVIIPEPESELSPVPVTTASSAERAGSVIITALIVIGTALAIGAAGAGGFFLLRHFMGYNTTIYSINGPREIVKAGRIKLDLNNPEPVIILNNVIGHTPAGTDRYIIQIARRAVPKLINKIVRVVLYDKEAVHKVPEKALYGPLYEFEVNFADDEPPDDEFITDGYPPAGNGSST